MNLSRLTGTYSIVAFDPENKQIGAAMQTHNFAACNGVVWAEPRVGAIASQAGSDPFYNVAGFKLMRLGKSAEQVLNSLVQCDPNAQHNQVAMLDVKGTVAAYTGERCIPETGHSIGLNYSCQANIMLKDTVWDAMGKAFENSHGELADRIMMAMEAAEREGGDMRGAQSAVIKIVSTEPADKPWEGNLYDFRVYDNPAPLQELRRLIELGRIHLQAYQAHRALYEEPLDDEKIALSIEQFNQAVSKMPNEDSRLQNQCAYGLSLWSKGKVEEARVLLQKVFATDPRWHEVARRVAKVNPDEPYAKMLDQIFAP